MIATIIRALFASLAGRPFAAVKNTKTVNFVMARSMTVIIHSNNKFFLSSLVILPLLHSYTSSTTVYVTNLMYQNNLP